MNVVTIRFLDVVKFTIPIPLPSLMSCKLSFTTTGLKISSLPVFVLKSTNKNFVW